MVHKLKLGEYFKMSKLRITFQNLLEDIVEINSPKIDIDLIDS